MCLILFSWCVDPCGVAAEDPAFPELVVAANRDEFHARPAAPAHFWSDRPRILAGRDLQAGGTWLGVSTDGRFAALTNWREPGAPAPSGARSRGELVADFLDHAEASAREFVDAVAERGDRYRGFTLLVADRDTLAVVSNRDGAPGRTLEPGYYGLSNASIDAPWPKNVRGKTAFEARLRAERAAESGSPGPSPHGDGRARDTTTDADDGTDAWFEMLADDLRADDADLPSTGLARERERALSSMFIRTPDYGTRCSTLVRRTARALRFAERSYDAAGEAAGTVRFRIEF